MECDVGDVVCVLANEVLPLVVDNVLRLCEVVTVSCEYGVEVLDVKCFFVFLRDDVDCCGFNCRLAPIVNNSMSPAFRSSRFEYVRLRSLQECPNDQDTNAF